MVADIFLSCDCDNVICCFFLCSSGTEPKPKNNVMSINLC